MAALAHSSDLTIWTLDHRLLHPLHVEPGIHGQERRRAEMQPYDTPVPAVGGWEWGPDSDQNSKGFTPRRGPHTFRIRAGARIRVFHVIASKMGSALRSHMIQALFFLLAAIQPTRSAVAQASCGIDVKDGVYSVVGAWTNQTHEYSNAACRQLSNRGRHQDCCRDEHQLFSPECFSPEVSLEAFLQASQNRHLAFWGDSLTRQNYHSLLNSMAVQVGQPCLIRDTNGTCWQGISTSHAFPISWLPMPCMA